jgi:hypothetical protein
MLSHQTNSDPPQEVEPQNSGLLDLSRQLRNLLLLRPLFQLELNKFRIGDEGTPDAGLFQGVDTSYLALSVLDLMMESTTISMGATYEEVLEHLANAAKAMKPALTDAQSYRVGETLLATLDNKANSYREFTFEHFDATKGAMRNVRFRLVRYEPDLEDVYRYRPTPEGYLVYLGMLDLSPEDSQELMEKMLDLLVQRGRFDAALDIAKRARTLSIEYRQRIRDRLHQAHRAPGSVNWSKDLGPYLSDARDHVGKRQHEDQRMEEAVKEALQEADELRTRASLAGLLKVLQSASTLRGQLVGDIASAGDNFLESQRSVFRARRPTGLPDLESRLLPQLLDMTVEELAASGEDLLSALYPTTWPKLYDLNTVFALLLEQRAEDGTQDKDDGEIAPYEPPLPEFPESVIRTVTGWLKGKFSGEKSYRVDELLDLAEDEGMDRAMRRCLVLILFRSFSPSETEFPQVISEATGRFFSDVAAGTNLTFTPKGAQE